ncbi:MAG TPA: CPBP family glutamic-type intramembrane protease, partial [Polyangiaceae bacterium]
MSVLGDRLQVVWLAVIVASVGAAAGFASSARFAGTATMVAIYGGVTVVLALVAAWRAWQEEALGDWLRPVGLDITRGCFAGGFLLFAAYLFSKYLLTPDSPRVGWIARVYLQLGEPSALRAHMTSISIVICVIALAEEMVWRGLVVLLLSELVGSRRAWIYAVVLYAIAHVPTAFALAD